MTSKRIVLAIVVLAITVFTAFIFIQHQVQNQTDSVSDKQVQNLQVDRTGDSTVNLNWDAVPGADSYVVYRSKDNRENFKKLDIVKDTAFTDNKSDQQTIYFYKVQAIGKDGQRSGFSKKVPNGELAFEVPIFAYHRFCSEIPWYEMGQGDYLFTDESVFDQEMKYLATNGYRTITTDEFYDWHQGKIELPRKCAMITMDDGNLSVILYALPILEKYNLKATTFMIGHSTYDVADYEPYDTDSYHHMGIDLMKEVQAKSDNLEFQSHTFDMHRSIGGERAAKVLPKEDFAADLKYMHDTYGYTSLAYPFGEYDDKMLEALEEDGNYKVAFTYGEDNYARRDQNRFTIPRIKVYGNHTVERFIDWLQ